MDQYIILIMTNHVMLTCLKMVKLRMSNQSHLTTLHHSLGSAGVFCSFDMVETLI